MVYQNKLVAAIKVGGQVLREVNSTVTIPFGSEYSIYLKNLNSVRVTTKISIDGADATGTWLIIQPNNSIELERYIRDGNLERGNRFKFIARSKEVEAHRGITAEDGLVRVEYKTERRVVDVPIIRHYDVPVPRYPRFPRPPYGPYRRYDDRLSARRLRASASASVRRATHPTRKSSLPTMDSAFGHVNPSEGSMGITTSGSESNQRFVSGEWFPTESQSDVIVLHLRGEVAGKKVKAALTVKDKPQCSMCGKVNKSDVLYCSRCGTSLTLI